MSDGPLVDAERQKSQRERQEQIHRQRELDFQDVMATPAGRRFVWRIIDSVSGTFGASHTGDALGGAHGEGRRSVGIAIMREAQRVASQQYIEMVREWIEERQLDAAMTPPVKPQEDE